MSVRQRFGTRGPTKKKSKLIHYPAAGALTAGSTAGKRLDPGLRRRTNPSPATEAMAKSNVLNTNTINYLDLIGNGKRYRVPPYQRDYSWSEEQWEDLWNDLMDLRSDPDERHYLGALVVEERGDREFLIIDGQQRLATLSVLALAVIARLGAMADEGIDAAANRERALALRNRFIGEKDPASLTESSRLYLNETDDAVYQDYLVQNREPLNPRRLPRRTTCSLACEYLLICRHSSAGGDCS